ncbi:MAG: N-acetylglucosamine-6-phosphate isomerase [Sphingomonas taxi]|uniref:N-acetylglucosamine-6-phosphate isomerase n=1 Tax=Sphingomonas taxi TaxID=1549858 RepID=A0A2W5P624_9SPHN|nr:MAG: N-acetylglucosamine-6-phosphate isomerase [Sphingomonas taxi]
MTLRSICLHGPESTGKSTMAPRLARQFDTTCIAEFGRTYCETYGIDLTMADLVVIAQSQDIKARKSLEAGARPLIMDTDPLMSAVWAEMLFGRRDPWFDRWHDYADLYLLFDIDLPWIEDGTRMFGSVAERRRFFDLCQRELERRGVRWALVSGQGYRRYLNALAAIHAAM